MKNKFYVELGMELQNIRKSRNFSQSYMADRLGVTRQCISNYEHAVSEISAEDVMKYCDICDVNVNDVYNKVRKYAYKK